MKKATLVIVGLVFVAGLCFGAEQGASPAKPKPAAAVKTETAQGTIDSITPYDPVKKTRTSFSVKDDKGNATTFILSSVTVYNADAKAIKFTDLKVGDKVTLEYFKTKAGANKVRKITILK